MTPRYNKEKSLIMLPKTPTNGLILIGKAFLSWIKFTVGQQSNGWDDFLRSFREVTKALLRMPRQINATWWYCQYEIKHKFNFVFDCWRPKSEKLFPPRSREISLIFCLFVCRNFFLPRRSIVESEAMKIADNRFVDCSDWFIYSRRLPKQWETSSMKVFLLILLVGSQSIFN